MFNNSANHPVTVVTINHQYHNSSNNDANLVAVQIGVQLIYFIDYNFMCNAENHLTIKKGTCNL